MRILAIETSCDETGIAIIESRERKRSDFCLLSNALLSQVNTHKKWGGVVPNLAAREHQRNLVPILKVALDEAKLLNSKFKIQNSKLQSKIQKVEKILEREPVLLKEMKKFLTQYEAPDVDAIAVTHGPGLAPALWVGVNFAKALAFLWEKPAIPVNHMEGHIFSNFIERPSSLNALSFPALCLLVSGGHTQLVLMKDIGTYNVIGETLDDAAGEAFDKVAIMLGLSYPGGRPISQLAEKWKSQCSMFNFQSKSNSKFQIPKPHFPRPMLQTKNFNFSFSGLKTAVLYFLKAHPEVLKSESAKAAVAAEFQDAVVEVLVAKTIRAAREYKTRDVLLAGGVAANALLRERLAAEIKKLKGARLWIPPIKFSGDNGAMIASAAYFRYQKNPRIAVSWKKLTADANLRL